MSMNEITILDKKRILDEAYEIYIKHFYVEVRSGVWVELSELNTTAENRDGSSMGSIDSVILDNGTLYLNDFADWAVIWNLFRDNHPTSSDSYQIDLIAMAKQWHFNAFDGNALMYAKYINELAISIRSMCYYGNQKLSLGDKSKASYVCCDDAMFNRLDADTIDSVLKSNLWVVFLYTLAFRCDDIVAFKSVLKYKAKLMSNMADG